MAKIIAFDEEAFAAADLDTVLLEFAEGPVEMEHIYDY